jgi:hypothetical protein
LAGLAVAPSTARAEIDLPDVTANRGIGAGTFRFWPRVDLTGGYDSNVYYLSDEDSGVVRDAAVVAVAPGLRVENPEYGDFHLQLDLAGRYLRYLSGDERLDDKQSNFEADATLRLGFFERRDFSFALYDAFQHKLDTPNFSTTRTFNRLANKAGTRLAVHPGGIGRRKAFTVALDYAFELQRFLDDERDDLDFDVHEVALTGEWWFFPLTALVWDVGVQARLWRDGSAALSRNDSVPLRLRAGFTGFITRRIAATAIVGYGQGFYADGPDIQTPLADVSLTYTPMLTTVLTVGYSRDFADSFYGNFYAFDRLYLDVKQRLWDRLTLRATGGYYFIDFSDFTAPGAVAVSGGDRREEEVDVLASAELEVARWIALDVSYRYRNRFSDFRQVSEGTGALLDAGGFERHFAMAGVSIRY